MEGVFIKCFFEGGGLKVDVMVTWQQETTGLQMQN